jgi:regulator of replication initiation timing
MAKALYGYVGGPTPQQVQESARLRRRISDLEAEVSRLKVENDGLLKTLSESVEHASASGELVAPVL